MANFDFFVSYTKADAAWAEWIAWQLEATGKHVLIQNWDFRPGANFVLEMQRALREATTLIAVLSPDYLLSGFALAEWAAAFAASTRGTPQKLIPVRVRDFVPDGLFAQLIYIDLVGLSGPAASKALIDGVLVSRNKPVSAPTFPGEPPRAVAANAVRPAQELLVDIIQASSRQLQRGSQSGARPSESDYRPILDLILSNSGSVVNQGLVVPRLSIDVSAVNAVGCTFPGEGTTGAILSQYDIPIDLQRIGAPGNILQAPLHLRHGESIDLRLGFAGSANVLYTISPSVFWKRSGGATLGVQRLGDRRVSFCAAVTTWEEQVESAIRAREPVSARLAYGLDLFSQHVSSQPETLQLHSIGWDSPLEEFILIGGRVLILLVIDPNDRSAEAHNESREAIITTDAVLLQRYQAKWRDFCGGGASPDPGGSPPARSRPSLPTQETGLPHCLFCGTPATRVGACAKCQRTFEFDDCATMHQCKACSQWTPLAGPHCGHCGARHVDR